jgi:hypothetical protein
MAVRMRWPTLKSSGANQHRVPSRQMLQVGQAFLRAKKAKTLPQVERDLPSPIRRLAALIAARAAGLRLWASTSPFVVSANLYRRHLNDPATCGRTLQPQRVRQRPGEQLPSVCNSASILMPLG